MPNISAAHDLFNGDTAPAAPDAGFTSFFFLNGRMMMRRPGQAPIDLMPRWPLTFNLPGDAVVDAQFGWHTAPEALYVTRLELEAQEAPSGAGITVTLTDADGTSLARTITLAGGDRYTLADITDLAIAAGAVIRAKVTAAESSEPGGWLTLRVFVTPQ
jgi:hypothetical protein